MSGSEPLISLLHEPCDGGSKGSNFELNTLLVYEGVLHPAIDCFHQQIRNALGFPDSVLLGFLCVPRWRELVLTKQYWILMEGEERGNRYIPVRWARTRDLWWWSSSKLCSEASNPFGSASIPTYPFPFIRF